MTNSKNIALYQLGLGSLKTYLLAAAFVIGNIALPQLCHLVPQGGLILLPIYPAREEPIPGVTSEMLGGQVVQKAELVAELQRRVAASREPVVVLTVGAGDIDRLVPQVAQALSE